jgi:hypothetical protein
MHLDILWKHISLEENGTILTHYQGLARAVMNVSHKKGLKFGKQ